MGTVIKVFRTVPISIYVPDSEFSRAGGFEPIAEYRRFIR